MKLLAGAYEAMDLDRFCGNGFVLGSSTDWIVVDMRSNTCLIFCGSDSRLSLCGNGFETDAPPILPPSALLPPISLLLVVSLPLVIFLGVLVRETVRAFS